MMAIEGVSREGELVGFGTLMQSQFLLAGRLMTKVGPPESVHIVYIEGIAE